MKIFRCIAGLVCICTFLFFPSCNSSTVTAALGDWRKAAFYGGNPRGGAVSFTIGNKAYVGLGYNGLVYLNDFFVFDVEKNLWDTVPAFPGYPREQAVAFSLNGKGYVGTGFNRDSIAYLKDFWEFDPVASKWTQLNDFAGGGRTNALAFTDGTYGYITTGFDTDFYSDCWKYDAGLDKWVRTGQINGDKRQQAQIMQISGKTYLFGGTNNGSFTYDLWEFDATAQVWTERTPLVTDAQYNNFKLAVSRYDAVTFELDGKGYIATGSNGSFLNTVYQFDPILNTYTLMTAFERAPRSQAVSFVVTSADKPRAFVTTGLNASNRFDDMMEFLPLEVYVANN